MKVSFLIGALVCAMAYSWMSPEVTAPNERSRLYLTISLIESGRISVTDEVRRFGKPSDISERNGKFYTDKAPGSSVIAVPFFWVYRLFGGDMNSIERMTNFARTFVMLPFAFLSLLILHKLLQGLEIRDPIANRTVVIFALGTSFFHYGSAFFGHALVTCAALGAAYALWKASTQASPRTSLAWNFVAGLCGGVAFTIEYQAVVIAAGLGLGFLTISANRSIKPILAFGVAMALPVLAIFAYNIYAFGNPFMTSYGHLHDQSVQASHSPGLFGITLPTLTSVYGLLFSPARGLLVCAPLVAIGIASLGLVSHD